MNNKGQSVLSEHVMIIFVVIAALVAMTTYVQRELQARMHDARNYMINSVINSEVCDASCVQATGGNILYEYEPYYSKGFSVTKQDEKDYQGSTTGSRNAIGVIYYKTLNETTATQSSSTQIPPECSGANPPGIVLICRGGVYPAR